MGAPYSKDFRQCAVKLSKKLKSITKAAAQLEVGRKSIERWIKLEKKTGKIEGKTTRNRKPNKLDLEEFKKYFRAHPSSTLQEASLFLGVSSTTVRKYLRRFRIKKKLLKAI